VKLHVGSGAHRFPGWKNFDERADVRPDFVGDAKTLDGVATNSCTHIYASHVLEHFPHAKIVPILKVWASRLKKGGKMWISVPDIDVIADLHCKHKDRLGPPSFPWNALIYGGQEYPGNFHHVGFNEKFLRYCMAKAGLVGMKKMPKIPIDGVTDYSTCRYEGTLISLNMEATRP